MNQMPEPKPLTLKDIEGLPNTYRATSPAMAHNIAALHLTMQNGPIVSKKLFVDVPTNKLVYEYYRVRNKNEKIYIIF